MFRALFTPLESRQGGGLLWALAREAGRLGCDERDVIIANAIGLLFQPYEATAGLIGNTLLALNRNRGLRQLVAAEPDLLRDVILEVLRYDSPVQNTRRFVGEDGIVAEHPMKAGDTILVVLAAANRDPAANPNPEQFEMNRKGRRTFTFGVGAHACPGETLAVAIAKAGVEHLIASGVAYGLITDPARYRASANTRVPLLGRPARVECG
jgi:cytochrome P450